MVFQFQIKSELQLPIIQFLRVEMKRCYYQILQVDRKAPADVIKKSYRKLALKFHPDKNPEEDTTPVFVEINNAYNVLSDVNERTWYDNNREKILFNRDGMSKEDLEQYSFGFNIWNYFTMTCFTGFEDDEDGFYSTYRDAFEKIKTEEGKAYNIRDDIEEEFIKFEGFGDSTTIEEKVVRFYEDWDTFNTYKTFVWIEKWDLKEGANRWERREMEKQNKKERIGEKKTFLKTIKDLVAYVRKRDPRFKLYQQRLKEEEEKKLIEKLEKEKQRKVDKEEMQVVKQRNEQQRFRESDEYFQRQNEAFDKNSTPTENYAEEELVIEFECHLCEKPFKSENQLRNHEKSKQHRTMVKAVEREVMLKEERRVTETYEETLAPVVEEDKKEDVAAKRRRNKKKKKDQKAQKSGSKSDGEEEKEEPVPVAKPTPKAKGTKKEKTPPKPTAQLDSESDDEDVMKTLLNNHNKKPQTQTTQEAPKQDNKKKTNPVKPSADSDSDESKEEAKVGKAKLKKQKKAAQQKNGKTEQSKCNTCNESFQSKSKLFDHINKTGHALAK